MSAPRLIRNRYRATCRSCTGRVAEGAGRSWPIVEPSGEKKWHTVHVRCQVHYFWREVGLGLPVTPGDWAGPWAVVNGPDVVARVGRGTLEYDPFTV